jgi:hypothetical protein
MDMGKTPSMPADVRMTQEFAAIGCHVALAQWSELEARPMRAKRRKEACSK